LLSVLIRRALAAATAAALVTAVPTVAAADPDNAGSEGANATVADLLESTSRGFIEARTAYRNAKTQQVELNQQLVRLTARRDKLSAEVVRVAAAGYRTGRLNAASALLRSAGPDSFLDRASALETMTERENQRLRDFNQARAAVEQAKAEIDKQAALEQQQFDIMTKRKQAAEKQFVLVDGSHTKGLVNANLPVARQSPRGADGGWPGQSCSDNDPTTDGCITPRTLFALNEAKRAHFNRFVSCFRPGGPFEHPKGRACDFSVQKQKGFGGDATGGDKIYGNNLAAFLVQNADKLGIMYVIWYKRCWLPSSGWVDYTEGGGDPSSDHTNHVHMSIL